MNKCYLTYKKIVQSYNLEESKNFYNAACTILAVTDLQILLQYATTPSLYIKYEKIRNNNLERRKNESGHNIDWTSGKIAVMCQNKFTASGVPASTQINDIYSDMLLTRWH